MEILALTLTLPHLGPGMFVSMLKESMPPGSKGHTYCCGIFRK